MRVVPGCFCYPIRFSVHIWPLNQAVFGLAVSLPENNCLASIRTITGFPPMTEISGIPAYSPFKCTFCSVAPQTPAIANTDGSHREPMHRQRYTVCIICTCNTVCIIYT
ncbi:hypothetical protein ALP82_200292 [Pseudomonas savastanoi pv. fraxini]|nr:hypothetical protein ALP82_200292 [Pseudomonas savastanoi pv. fraxini]